MTDYDIITFEIVSNYERIIVQSESIVKQTESIFAFFGVQMESIKEILDRLCLFYEVSNNRKLSEKIDINYNTISTWIKRDSVPYDKLHKIVQKESISFDWLLTGKGKMLIDDKNSFPTVPNTSLSNDVVSINYYEDIYASAGFGSYAEDYIPIVMEFDRNFLEKILNVKRFDNLDIIRVTGDSMLPYIKDGEFIIVERGSDAKSGDTVIACVDGELYVKRLKKVPFEKWIILESENNEYPSIELNTQAKLQAFTIIGVMRSKIKLY